MTRLYLDMVLPVVYTGFMATKLRRKQTDYHTEPPKSIRGLDPELWARVKGEALAQDTQAFRVLNQALREYLDYRDYLARKGES